MGHLYHGYVSHNQRVSTYWRFYAHSISMVKWAKPHPWDPGFLTGRQHHPTSAMWGHGHDSDGPDGPETVGKTWETNAILMDELVDHQVFKMIIYWYKIWLVVWNIFPYMGNFIIPTMGQCSTTYKWDILWNRPLPCLIPGRYSVGCLMTTLQQAAMSLAGP